MLQNRLQIYYFFLTYASLRAFFFKKIVFFAPKNLHISKYFCIFAPSFRRKDKRNKQPKNRSRYIFRTLKILSFSSYKPYMSFIWALYEVHSLVALYQQIKSRLRGRVILKEQKLKRETHLLWISRLIHTRLKRPKVCIMTPLLLRFLL